MATPLERANRYMTIGAIIGLPLVALALALFPFQPTANTLFLLILGMAFASVAVRIGDRFDMSVSHPFIFAAMLLEGPSSAVVVSLFTVLGTAWFRRDQMTRIQVAFNMAAISICATASWATYALFVSTETLVPIDRAVIPVLFASLVFYLVNTGLVAVAVSLMTVKPLLRVWYDNAFWSAPSFFAGGAIGLVSAHLLARWGGVSLLLVLPFCFIIHLSYRLYLDRLSEKKDRLELVEELNAELESKVLERTGELLGLNDKLTESNLELAEASRLKNEFMANVSHELRTPLNAIIGFSELLCEPNLRELDGETQQEFVRDINSSGKGLLRLIEDILDIAKIEAGKTDMQLIPCDPAGVVLEAVAMVRVLAANKNIELTASAEGVDSMVLDPEMLKRILWNLLSNGIKFTPVGGSIAITVEREGETARFTVSDSGIGIDQQNLNKVFENFYQVDGSHTRRHGGTGLGLALTKKLTERLGGSIELTSRLGEGSSFVFRLPIAGPAACPILQPQAELQAVCE